MKLLFVFGTRPEAIKILPIVKKLKGEKRIKYKLCITAQHRQMLDSVMKSFGTDPDYDLNIMIENQTLEYITIQTIKKIREIMLTEKPDLVLVQGDTTSAMVTALESYYLKIKVAHIEAGLRTHDNFNPYPEEVNRVFIDKLSSICFAPTQNSKLNILNEGIPEERVFVSGNTVIDALKYIKPLRPKGLNNVITKKIVLFTSHRRENFGEPHMNIFKAIRFIAEKYKDIHIIYPVHPNPMVKKNAYKVLSNVKNIHLINPLPYEQLLYLMKKCYFIITDSGGIQEEAPSFKKPVLIIREKTERPEGVNLGIAKIVGRDTQKIIDETQKLIEDKSSYEKMIPMINPYGDGKASERIINFLKYYFGYSSQRPQEFCIQA